MQNLRCKKVTINHKQQIPLAAKAGEELNLEKIYLNKIQNNRDYLCKLLKKSYD